MPRGVDWPEQCTTGWCSEDIGRHRPDAPVRSAPAVAGPGVARPAVAGPRIPGPELPDQLFPDQLFPDHEFPDQLFPDHEFPDQLFPDHEFPDQLLPDHEFPTSCCRTTSSRTSCCQTTSSQTSCCQTTSSPTSCCQTTSSRTSCCQTTSSRTSCCPTTSYRTTSSRPRAPRPVGDRVGRGGGRPERRGGDRGEVVGERTQGSGQVDAAGAGAGRGAGERLRRTGQERLDGVGAEVRAGLAEQRDGAADDRRGLRRARALDEVLADPRRRVLTGTRRARSDEADDRSAGRDDVGLAHGVTAARVGGEAVVVRRDRARRIGGADGEQARVGGRPRERPGASVVAGRDDDDDARVPGAVERSGECRRRLAAVEREVDDADAELGAVRGGPVDGSDDRSDVGARLRRYGP